MCVARHAQIIQNKKFDIPLQYLKRQVNDEVDFLHAGKHENLQQIDTMTLMEMVKHFLVKHFQSSKNFCTFPISVQYLKKEDWDEVDKYADKYQSGLQVDFNTLAPNLAIRWYYDSW